MLGKIDLKVKSYSPGSLIAMLVCTFGTETIGSISLLCFAIAQWPPLTNSYIWAFCRALGAIRRRLILSGSRQSSYNWPECAKPSPYFHTIILPIDPIVSSSSSSIRIPVNLIWCCLYPLFIKFSIFNNASLARRFQNITIKCSVIGTINEFQSKRCSSKYFASFIF